MSEQVWTEQSWTRIETKEEAISWLEKAVAERGGDFVSQSRPVGGPAEEIRGPYCVYVWENKPDCMIGVALHLAGWRIAELEARNDLDILDLTKFFQDRLSEEAARIFNVAQYSQDTGRAWGQALEDAKEAI